MINGTPPDENSFIHQTDMRLKLIYAVIYTFTVALSHNFLALFFSLFVSGFLISLSGLSFKHVFRRLKVVVLFLLFIWVFLPISGNGDILFQFGFYKIYMDGIILAAQISLKSISILFTLISLVSTMGFSNLGNTLTAFKVPDKLVVLFMMTYRYIHVLEGEYKKLLRAVKVRGFIPDSSIHTYKTYAYILGMLFVKSSLRGKRVHHAMLCRGFSGKFHTLSSTKSGKGRYTFSSLMISVIVILVVLEHVSI